MEKSIESIWKEGVITNDFLSAPQIENISDMKSIYFIDKFKRTYRNNILGLGISAVIVLLAFMLGSVPFIGIFMFGLLAILAIIGQRELSKLNNLHLNDSNYEYLKSFDSWLKSLFNKFSLIYKIWIPLFFIGFSLAILNTSFFVPFIGETIIDRLSDHEYANLLQMGWLMGTGIIAFGLSYYSNFFFKKEMKSIYGGILERLNSLILELEE